MKYSTVSTKFSSLKDHFAFDKNCFRLFPDNQKIELDKEFVTIFGDYHKTVQRITSINDLLYLHGMLQLFLKELIVAILVSKLWN